MSKDTTQNQSATGRRSRLDVAKAMLSRGEGNPFEQRGRKIVSITKIFEDPRNERKTFRNMDGLIASVKTMGVVEPPTVVPYEGDAFMLTTGHRRFRAAKAAGLTEIEVLIREPESEKIRRRKSVVSNVQREDVGPVELAEGLQSLLDEDDEIATQRDLAQAIGKDDAWVSSILRVLTLPAPLQQRLRASQVSVSYDTAIKIAREKETDFQSELIDDVIAGATMREIRDKINTRKGKPTSKQRAAAKSVESAGQPKELAKLATKARLPESHNAYVVIQPMTDEPLTVDRQIAVLQDGLKYLRKKLRDQDPPSAQAA